MKARIFAPAEVVALKNDAEELAMRLRDLHISTQVINRSSLKLDDLRLVAQYGVVEPFVLVFYEGQKIYVRLTTMPRPAEIERVVQRVLQSCN